MGETLFIETVEGRFAYDEAGAGPLVVCVPSMGDLRQEYRFLAPLLAAAAFRVATLDLRGLGESSIAWKDYSVVGVASDIGALIERLDAKGAIVVADSMGAGAAVYLAAERPDLVNALVLMDPFVRGAPKPIEKVLYSVLFAAPWGPLVWKSYYAALYPSRKPADFPDYTRRLSANLAEKGRMAALRAMMLASKEASGRALSRVRCPSVVIMGKRDPDFKDPEATARALADELGAAYRMVEGAGHYPHAEFPEETASLILDFLASAARPGAGRA